MVKLGREIVRLIIEDNGPEEILNESPILIGFQSRLPSRFRLALLGRHHHGLRRPQEGIRGRERMGSGVAGGKGRRRARPAGSSLPVKDFLYRTTPKAGLSQPNRLTAKIDNNAIKTAFTLSSQFLSPGGSWAVVQQGMNGSSPGATTGIQKTSNRSSAIHTAICSDLELPLT
jgi:hypothetical protein